MAKVNETTYVIKESPKSDDAVRYPAALKRMPNAPSVATLISREVIRAAIHEDAERETMRWEKLAKV